MYYFKGSTNHNGKALVDWITIFCTLGLEDMFDNQPKAYTLRSSALSSTAACSASRSVQTVGGSGSEFIEDDEMLEEKTLWVMDV